MLITRDKDDISMICFWKHGTKLYQGKFCGLWYQDDTNSSPKYGLIAEMSPFRFKQLNPTKRMPRKGSCQSVRKRDYVGG